MSIRKEILSRAYITFYVLVLVSVVIMGQVIKIDTVERAYWIQRGEDYSIRKQNVEAQRGNIYADDGSLLATSIPYFDIRIDFGSEAMRDEYFNQHVDSLSIYLQRDIWPKRSVAQIKQKLVRARKDRVRSFLIARNADFTVVEKVKKYPLLSLGGYKGGLVLERKSSRLKPYGNLASRSIGRMAGDRKPLGLEMYYDDLLGGKDGLRYVQRIARGIDIPIHDLTEIDAQEGHDLQTSINVNLQDIAEYSLRQVLTEHEAEWGTAIVMEVKSGHVKAIANLGQTASGGYYENLNYGVGRLYELGSTFKLATMLALFEDQDLELDDPVSLGPGYMRVGSGIIRDSEGHPFDTTTIEHNFAISSNVGMAKLAIKYFRSDDGPDRFFKYMKQFHLKSKTGIEIPGEPEPDIYSKEERKNIPGKKGTWSSVMSIPYMAHGYELRTTPLQILAFYNAVANDGYYVPPRLGEKVMKSGSLVRMIHPNMKSVRIASESSIKKAQHLLKEVVLNGTGKNLISPDYSVAGKTGTTRINYADKDAKRKKYIASFVGYFPTDQPKYSCIVVVNDPKKHAYYGSKIAAPVFKEIVDYCYATDPNLMKVLNDKPMLASAQIQLPVYEVGYSKDFETVFGYLGLKTRKSTESEWTVILQDSTDFTLAPRAVREKAIPNVVGMGLRDALYLLENLDVRVVVQGTGKVTRQSIEPGSPINNKKIFLTLG
ncbi:transpeptidase family protein [Membranicola marinus]|uniref:Transpeptidase family protein n=1 Tax=Membranihabitans marinus TaxID=1227546 RepID=A0A953HKH4_9BACT|nr:penicillin-binding protein [Membranihabitans marinus]MBY5957549.1 transpeptidase family protein [Membranihabitans marinus]